MSQKNLPQISSQVYHQQSTDVTSKLIESTHDTQSHHKIPKFMYFMLLVTELCASMDAPFSQFLTTTNGFLRMAWKFQGVFIIFTLIESFRLIIGKSSIKPTVELIKKHPHWLIDLVFAACGVIGQQSFLSWGSNYTIMADANIYSSLASIIIVSIKLVTCKKTKKLEILGCVIAICGCIVTSNDSSASKVDTSTQNLPYGNSLCFISSIFATLYLIKAATISQHMSLMHYLILLNFFVVLIYYTIFPIILHSQFTYSMDEYVGLFGWMTKTNFWYCLLVVSLINGCGTLFLQGLDLQYFSPVIVGAIQLVEPVISQVYGCYLGIDEVPGLLTYIGGTITIIGLLQIVVVQDEESHHDFDIKESDSESFTHNENQQSQTEN